MAVGRPAWGPGELKLVPHDEYWAARAYYAPPSHSARAPYEDVPPQRGLALSGGGVGGLLQASLLSLLPSVDDFDVIIGTSVGALNGAMLALGVAPNSLMDAYTLFGTEFFVPYGTVRDNETYNVPWYRGRSMTELTQTDYLVPKHPFIDRENWNQNVYPRVADIPLSVEARDSGLITLPGRRPKYSRYRLYVAIRNVLAHYGIDEHVTLRDVKRRLMVTYTLTAPPYVGIADSANPAHHGLSLAWLLSAAAAAPTYFDAAPAYIGQFGTKWYEDPTSFLVPRRAVSGFAANEADRPLHPDAGGKSAVDGVNLEGLGNPDSFGFIEELSFHSWDPKIRTPLAELSVMDGGIWANFPAPELLTRYAEQACAGKLDVLALGCGKSSTPFEGTPVGVWQWVWGDVVPELPLLTLLMATQRMRATRAMREAMGSRYVELNPTVADFALDDWTSILDIVNGSAFTKWRDKHGAARIAQFVAGGR